MVALPSRAQIVDVLADGPTMAPRFGDMRDFIAQLGGGQADSEITVAAGIATPDRYFHRVDTEGEAATDNLDQIALTNLPDGSLVVFMAENAARVNTFRHLNGTGTPGTNGEMVLNNDENFALDHVGKRIALRRKGTQWVEEARWTVYGRRLAGAADALAARTLLDGQQATGSLTENTAPALTDFLPMTVGGNHRKVQLINAFNRITAATALTAVAIDDEIFIYDLSAATAKKITPVELLKVVNALTEDTTPDLAADFVLTYDASAGTVKKVKPSNIATPPKFALYQNQQTSGTAGPNPASGSWQTFPLTTEVYDAGAIASLASNQITIAGAGDYVATGFCSLVGVSGPGNIMARLRFRNVSDGATLDQGANSGALGTATSGMAMAVSYFTLAASKAIELQIYRANTGAVTALSTGDVEVYASVFIEKVR